jgi:hypothetical protein
MRADGRRVVATTRVRWMHATRGILDAGWLHKCGGELHAWPVDVGQLDAGCDDDGLDAHVGRATCGIA